MRKQILLCYSWFFHLAFRILLSVPWYSASLFSIMDRYKTINIMFCLSIRMWCDAPLTTGNVEDVRIQSCGWTTVHDMMRNESNIRIQQVSTSTLLHAPFFLQKNTKIAWPLLSVREILWAYLQLFQCLVCPWRFECVETISIEPLDVHLWCNIKTNSRAKAHTMWANVPQNGCNVREWKRTHITTC